MKLLMCLLLFGWSYALNAQIVVNDPVNNVALLKQYAQQLEDYSSKLKQWRELVDSNKWLDQLIGEEGLWADTFKALENIHTYVEEARDVISIIQARDVYALIKHLPVDNEWKSKMYTVLDQAHGLLPTSVFDELVSHVSQKNPILSDFLIRSRMQGRGGLDHRLNSYYYASARKGSTDLRLNTIVKQKGKIQSFTNRSQGEATNMINSQLLLISQQNEEILNALTHLIVNSQTEYFENLRKEDEAYKNILNYEAQRRALDINDYMPN